MQRSHVCLVKQPLARFAHNAAHQQRGSKPTHWDAGLVDVDGGAEFIALLAGQGAHADSAAPGGHMHVLVLQVSRAQNGAFIEQAHYAYTTGPLILVSTVVFMSALTPPVIGMALTST